MFTTQLEPSQVEVDGAAIASACRRYLVATRSASADAYESVESRAWLELLRALERSGRPLDFPLVGG